MEKLLIQTNKTQEKVLRESINLYKELLRLKEEFGLQDKIAETDFTNFEKELKIRAIDSKRLVRKLEVLEDIYKNR